MNSRPALSAVASTTERKAISAFQEARAPSAGVGGGAGQDVELELDVDGGVGRLETGSAFRASRLACSASMSISAQQRTRRARRGQAGRVSGVTVEGGSSALTARSRTRAHGP